MIDFEGNLWSFGDNNHGQLGHGDILERQIPIKIESLKDIQQISYGTCGKNFLAKDSQNTIFVSGYNVYGQLGNKKPVVITTPKEINSEYFSIWGEPSKSKAKSARK